MTFGVGLDPVAGFFNRAMLANAGDDILKGAPLRCMIEDIIDCNDGYAAGLHPEIGKSGDLLAITPGEGEPCGKIEPAGPWRLQPFQTLAEGLIRL